MKRLLLIFVSIIFVSCSFDNKTGIWKDASNTPIDNQVTRSIERGKSNSRYEDIFIKNQTYNKEKKPLNILNVEIDEPFKGINWPEIYAVPTNNVSNFSYSGNKKLLSKTSKLSKFPSSRDGASRDIIFYKNNLISYDHKGTIFIYSLDLNKKIFEYNFYKKKFKKFDKEIHLIVNEDILYAADNLGYLYALNLNNKSIVWAKNYGIPFRSNLKFAKNQIFLANQDNVIYSINSNSGNKDWQFATNLTFLKNDFQNNFALDILRSNLLFLNTNGELYSINYLSQKINWVLNFKKSSKPGDTELFLSHPIVIKNDSIFISTEKKVTSYDLLKASRKWNLSAIPIIKPIITSNYTYAILKNNLLICIDNVNGNVVWSKNIFGNRLDNKIKKKFDSIIDFKMVNNIINIYSRSGYLLSFNPNDGNLKYQNRISKNGINSKIFFLNNNMFFLDSDNRLLKFN